MSYNKLSSPSIISAPVRIVKRCIWAVKSVFSQTDKVIAGRFGPYHRIAMFNWLKKLRIRRLLEKDDLRLYPNARSCVRSDMSQVPPQQMPPLMVRKAAWRK
jgi:hypothetical protein